MTIVPAESCNGERVIAWLDDPARLPAHRAFTDGVERQIAYRVEALLRRHYAEQAVPADGETLLIQRWLDVNARYERCLAASKNEVFKAFHEGEAEMIDKALATITRLSRPSEPSPILEWAARNPEAAKALVEGKGVVMPSVIGTARFAQAAYQYTHGESRFVNIDEKRLDHPKEDRHD